MHTGDYVIRPVETLCCWLWRQNGTERVRRNHVESQFRDWLRSQHGGRWRLSVRHLDAKANPGKPATHKTVYCSLALIAFKLPNNWGKIFFPNCLEARKLLHGHLVPLGHSSPSAHETLLLKWFLDMPRPKGSTEALRGLRMWA